MISTTLVQFVRADDLTKNGYNSRVLYDEFGKNRGKINVKSNGELKTIAYSNISNDAFKYQRIYVDSQIYAPITGFYSIANKADRGIESALNDELNGNIPQLALNNFADMILGKEVAGADVNLTIDATLQEESYKALKNTGYNGAIVALNPQNGAILALSSFPTIDYNTFAVHSTSDASIQYSQASNDPNSPLTNRAIDEVYPPGSTFKLIDTAIFLESGKYKPESVVLAPNKYTLPGTVTDLPNYANSTCRAVDGVESLLTALSQSCNTPFAILAGEFGQDEFLKQANKFGFGQNFDLIGGKTFAQTDNSSSLTSLRSKLIATSSFFPSKQSDDKLALSSIGQGDVTVTPLQDCLISAIIANKGRFIAPHIVESLVDNQNNKIDNLINSITSLFDNSNNIRVISEQTAQNLNKMMQYNITNGIASGASIKGVKVAGKTGTAENAQNKEPHSWFTGFAPADDPKIAIAVFLENGGTSAGVEKIAGKLISLYLNSQ